VAQKKTPWYAKVPLLEEFFSREDQGYTRYNEKEDRTRRIRAKLLAIWAIVTGLWYFALLPGGLNWDHPFVAVAFLVAEIACLAVFILSAVNVWSVRYKPEEGIPLEKHFAIDVFITACGEPYPILEKTVRAASQLEWDGPLQMYILDDGDSHELAALARSVGANYLSRPALGMDLVDRKAGNLNFGLEKSEGELVFVLDSDQIVASNALKAMAGYMKFPRVAFVQSKQAFDVPEGDPFNSEDPVFYDGVQLAFDNDDTVISCGSGVLYRREALEDIGGFATWNLVEDLTTSYELHSAGWKSLYYPWAVTRGLAPANINDVYQQRSQWAIDTMRMFFWDNPLFKKGLSWRARLNYLIVGLSYLWAGLAMPVFFLLPLWSYTSGNVLFATGEVEIILVRVAYFIFFALAVEYLFRFRHPGKQFQFLAGLFPVYAMGTIKALLHPRGRKPVYRVNNVAARSKRRRPVALTILPQILLVAGNAFLPFYAIFTGTLGPWVVAVNGLVSMFNLWTLWPTVTGSLTYTEPTVEPLAIRGESHGFAG
jgi:cellulose synthase (UDP-forming)